MQTENIRRQALWHCLAGILLTVSALAAESAEDTMILIDDRQSGDLQSSLGTQWRLISDGVMGGVSRGTLALDRRKGRDCLRLAGEVSTENNGGFIQAALPLAPSGVLDASAWSGVELDVFGNGEAYNVHFKTSRVWLPWQHYRAAFMAAPGWHTVQVPFAEFEGYRIGAAFDPAKLERIGIAAYGRAFTADLCIGRVAFYRAE
ncbi:MAG TPA: CIA30 family protein [Gammaproteobacteria bacterium]|nr:CIA30 family protein [Gammaproteobacteria bacterium]